MSGVGRTGNVEVGDPAPDLELLEVTGDEVALSSFWREGPAALFFLRYFGCPFCQTLVARLRDGRDAFRELGATIVLIGQGAIHEGKTFNGEHHLYFPLLLDPERAAYRAYGLRHASLGQIVSPSTATAWLRANAHGETRQRGLRSGSFTQLPGTFVVERQGAIRFAHRNRDAADDPEPEEVLDAIAGLGPGAS